MKMKFLVNLSVLMCLACLFDIAWAVVGNWLDYEARGGDKGNNPELEQKLGHWFSCLDGFWCTTYYLAHWLFSFRYWEVSQILSRLSKYSESAVLDKIKDSSNFSINALSGNWNLVFNAIMATIITANFTTSSGI